MSDRPWDTNSPARCAIFNAALAGILANPQFFGPIFQGEASAAVEFADRVVLAATDPTPPPKGPEHEA